LNCHLSPIDDWQLRLGNVHNCSPPFWKLLMSKNWVILTGADQNDKPIFFPLVLTFGTMVWLWKHQARKILVYVIFQLFGMLLRYRDGNKGEGIDDSISKHEKHQTLHHLCHLLLSLFSLFTNEHGNVALLKDKLEVEFLLWQRILGIQSIDPQVVVRGVAIA